MHRHGHCEMLAPLAKINSSMPLQPPEPAVPPSVLAQRFVRVLQRGPGDLVRFEFAIGWPDLSVELVLPSPSFDAFCLREHTLPWPDDTSAEPGLTP